MFQRTHYTNTMQTNTNSNIMFKAYVDLQDHLVTLAAASPGSYQSDC